MVISDPYDRAAIGQSPSNIRLFPLVQILLFTIANYCYYSDVRALGTGLTPHGGDVSLEREPNEFFMGPLGSTGKYY